MLRPYDRVEHHLEKERRSVTGFVYTVQCRKKNSEKGITYRGHDMGTDRLGIKPSGHNLNYSNDLSTEQAVMIQGVTFDHALHVRQSFVGTGNRTEVVVKIG